MEYSKLYVEKFLELKSVLGTTKFVCIFGKVYHTESFVKRHQLVFLKNVGAEGLLHLSLYQGEEIRGEFSHCLRVEPAALHALCGVIEWLQPHRGELHGLCVVDVGVCDVCATVENGGFAKDHISLSEFVFGLHEFYPLEPYKVDKTCTVGEVSHKPARSSFAHLFEAAYLAAELNMGLPAVYFAYFEETAAIDIFIWEIVQEVVQGIYFQFSVEERCTLFAYSGKIFYVSGCCVKHSTIAFASTKSNGVVILIFSRLPSTMCTNSPIASTTEASSVNCSR